MKEANISRLIQAHLSSLGHRVFRNNTGKLRDQRGIWVSFGLCVGSSDLIGWTRMGQFLAVEVKTPIGRISPEQINFIAAVRAAGGRAGIARTIKDAEDIADGIRKD